MRGDRDSRAADERAFGELHMAAAAVVRQASGRASYLSVIRRGGHHALGIRVSGGWRMEIEFKTAPTVTVHGVRMEPLDNASPVPQLNVPRLLQDCLEQVAAEDAAWLRSPPGAARAVVSASDPNRRDLELAASAALYVQLASAGVSGPVERLAETLGVSRATARMRLSRARQEGFLESVGERRAGGRLTTKAIRLLKQANLPGFEQKGGSGGKHS